MKSQAAKSTRLATRAERIDAAIKHLESVRDVLRHEKSAQVIPFPGPRRWKRP